MWERGGRKEGVLPDLSSHGAGQAVAVVKISSFSVKFSWVNCGNASEWAEMYFSLGAQSVKPPDS